MSILSTFLLCVTFWANLSLAGFHSRQSYVSSSYKLQKRSLEAHQLDGHPWSKNATFLISSSRKIHVLHNYTVVDGRPGRWTKREAMNDHALRKRGFGIDFANVPNAIWAHGYPEWAIANNLPVDIFLCFEDTRSQIELEATINEALCRWTNALGPRAGVRFVYRSNDDSGVICGPYDSRSVRLTYVAGEPGRSTVARIDLSTNRLSFDPRVFPGSYGYSAVSAATHELGHTLGLFHEHQRWDAVSWIEFRCDHVPGFERLWRRLRNEPGQHKFQFGPRRGQDLTINDFCSNAELSLGEPYRSDWAGGDIVPFGINHAENLPAEELRSSHEYELGRESWLALHGSFDPQSIMMYCGIHLWNAQTNGWMFYWRARVNIYCFPPNGERYPSRGDIALINDMYPPLRAEKF